MAATVVTVPKNVVFKNVFRNLSFNVLVVSYQFKDKLVNGRSFGPKIKDYYENNSRGNVLITVSYATAMIPFNYSMPKVNDAVALAKQQLAAQMRRTDITVHYCNPKVSHSGNHNSITWASSVNTIHEVGHLFGFAHANTKKYNANGTFTVIHETDPFDPMTSQMTYPSFNPAHRHQVGWYAPGEAVYAELGQTYTLAMLKDFTNNTNIKALYWTFTTNNVQQNYWISYGTNGPANKIILHSSNPNFKYSYLEGFYDVSRPVINHKPSGLSITITQLSNPKFILITLNAVPMSTASADGTVDPSYLPDPLDLSTVAVIEEHNDCDCGDQ
jgi:hypothetical protein